MLLAREIPRTGAHNMRYSDGQLRLTYTKHHINWRKGAQTGIHALY